MKGLRGFFGLQVALVETVTAVMTLLNNPSGIESTLN
jgi:hypothetical protein